MAGPIIITGNLSSKMTKVPITDMGFYHAIQMKELGYMGQNPLFARPSQKDTF